MMINLCSWNVNGIRAVAKKGFVEWLNSTEFHIVCLQETKAQMEQLEDDIRTHEKYPVIHFNSAERKGYSGVASFFHSKLVPEKIIDGFRMDIAEEIASQIGFDIALLESFNKEGRVICSHHKDFVLFNIYFPNGGANDERYRFKLRFYDFLLEYIKIYEKRENPNIIITGDYNTAHNEIDLARPKDNENTSGFIREERDYLDRFLEMGFTDTFRYLHPEPDNYTWWSYRTAARKRNVGWRIDYFFVSKSLLPFVCSAEILSNIEGSDHCPVSLGLNFS